MSRNVDSYDSRAVYMALKYKVTGFATLQIVCHMYLSMPS